MKKIEETEVPHVIDTFTKTALFETALSTPNYPGKYAIDVQIKELMNKGAGKKEALRYEAIAMIASTIFKVIMELITSERMQSFEDLTSILSSGVFAVALLLALRDSVQYLNIYQQENKFAQSLRVLLRPIFVPNSILVPREEEIEAVPEEIPDVISD